MIRFWSLQEVGSNHFCWSIGASDPWRLDHFSDHFDHLEWFEKWAFWSEFLGNHFYQMILSLSDPKDMILITRSDPIFFQWSNAENLSRSLLSITDHFQTGAQRAHRLLGRQPAAGTDHRAAPNPGPSIAAGRRRHRSDMDVDHRWRRKYGRFLTPENSAWQSQIRNLEISQIQKFSKPRKFPKFGDQ